MIEEKDSSFNPLLKKRTLINILQLSNNPENTIFRQMSNWLENSQHCSLTTQKTTETNLTIKSLPNHVLVLIYFESKTDESQTEALLDRLKNESCDQFHRIIIVDQRNPPSTNMYFQQLGCIIANLSDLTLRGLKRKIERQLILWDCLNRNELPPQIMNFWEDANNSPLFKIHWNKPIMIENDHWLLPIGRFVFKNYKKWMFYLLGPTPDLGEWKAATESVKVKPDLPMWNWMPATDQDLSLVREIGKWNFQGEKPVYRNQHWIFKSPVPELYFETHDGKRFTRLHLQNETELEISPNSRFYMRLLPQLSEQLAQIVSAQNPAKSSHHEHLVSHEISSKPQIIEKLADKRNLLKKAFDSKKVITLWIRSHSIRVACHLVSLNPSLTHIIAQVRNQVDGEQFFSLLKTLDQAQVFANFNLRIGALFFDVKIQDWEPVQNRLTLAMNESCFRLQRRTHFRVTVTPDHDARLKVAGHDVQLVDLSTGGAGFETDSEALKGSLTPGSLLSIELTIHDRKINCHAQLRWIKPTPLPIRIGLQFIDLKNLDFELIGFFVLDISTETEQ